MAYLLALFVASQNVVLANENDLQNSSWRLEKSSEPYLNKLISLRNLRIVFEESRFEAYDGCNWVRGRFETNSSAIFISEAKTTIKLCGGRSHGMQFIDELLTIQFFDVTNDQLRLFSESFHLLYRRID